MAPWFELKINKSGEDVVIAASGSGDREVAQRPLGGGFDIAAVLRFSEAVERAAKQARPLPDEIREMARALGNAILDGDIGNMRERLSESAKGPLLLRLNIGAPELQAVPWEAVCLPGQSFGFWATSPELFPVRRVATQDAWQPREIRGALRILAIAPTDKSSLPNLQAALASRIASGEVEWLDPVVGEATRAKYLFERLRAKPTPHVIHFLGHGTVRGGIPELRVGDEDEEERWIPVELIAQEIRSNFQGDLRAFILEACEGATPSAFASAAEILGRSGADAVVAHLWPVRADIARSCSEQLYRALTDTERATGDISRALNEARRSLFVTFDGTAQTFSPVIYLRGPDGEIFDYKSRKLSAAPATSSAPTISATVIPIAATASPALNRLLTKPYSLVLGDLGRTEHDAFMRLRDKLVKDLAKESLQISADAPLSTVAQLYTFLRGSEKLGNEFQKALRAGGMTVPPIIPAIAARICPGVHITLLRNPWLEEALAEKQPERTLYVIQPGEKGVVTYTRQAGSEWEESADDLTTFDPEKDIVLLRLFRGYTPENLFAMPLLTEDDYLHGLGDFETFMARDLANAITSTLNHRPALFLGVSMHAWHHRMLLHRTFPRGIPRESLAIVNSAGPERTIWQTGAGLPGKGEGIDVAEVSLEALDEVIQSQRAP
jgi:CHAT domain